MTTAMPCLVVILALLGAIDSEAIAQSQPDSTDHQPAAAVAAGDTGLGAVRSDSAYLDFQVDVPVKRLDHAFPRYPEALTSTLTPGCVIMEIVVDTTGRVAAGTAKIIKASDPRFATEVLRIVPQMRFSAAEKGGHKVRQEVLLPFGFDLRSLTGPVLRPKSC